jgi:hypothetical protein
VFTEKTVEMLNGVNILYEIETVWTLSEHTFSFEKAPLETTEI